MAQRAAATRENFDFGNNIDKKHDQIKGLDDVIEIDSDSDSDSNYDEDVDYIPILVKREDSDSRDDRSEVDPENNQNDVLIEDLH